MEDWRWSRVSLLTDIVYLSPDGDDAGGLWARAFPLGLVPVGRGGARRRSP